MADRRGEDLDAVRFVHLCFIRCCIPNVAIFTGILGVCIPFIHDHSIFLVAGRLIGFPIILGF